MLSDIFIVKKQTNIAIQWTIRNNYLNAIPERLDFDDGEIRWILENHCAIEFVKSRCCIAKYSNYLFILYLIKNSHHIK